MSDNGKHEARPSADVGAQRIAKVYAEALLNAAEKRGQTDEALDELRALVEEVFHADPQLEAFLCGAAVSRTPKAASIRKVFESRSSEAFFHFLLVLNDHDRLDLLRTILVEAKELRDQRARRMRVQVRSAVPLPDDQQERLRNELRESFHLEPILDVGVDPALIGGMVVRVGDWMVDASVRTRLETLRNQVIARSSHEIQSGRDRFSSTNGN